MNTSPFDTTPPAVAVPVTDTLVALIAAAVVVPVNVGEALGAKIVVMSVLLILYPEAAT
jgi:hypothetical protein